jgi:hypothetical protein
MDDESYFPHAEKKLYLLPILQMGSGLTLRSWRSLLHLSGTLKGNVNLLLAVAVEMKGLEETKCC